MPAVKKRHDKFYLNLLILVGFTLAIGFFAIAEIIYVLFSVGNVFSDSGDKLPNLQLLIISITALLILGPLLFRLYKK